MKSSGLRPKARSIRFAVPNRLVTTGKRLPFTRLKSKAGPALFDHAAMDFGEFEVWIDFRIDRNDFFFAGKQFEKCTQAAVHQAREYNSGRATCSHT